MGERVSRVVFVATAEAGDDEMRLKIEAHRTSRPAHWQTVEEPLSVAGAIVRHGPGCELMIVDCLSFFASNLLHTNEANPTATDQAVTALCSSLACPPCPIVLVSNEVGSGVVPAYALGRRFRDLLGEINQSVARVASNVLLMVAGLPLVLKGEAAL